MPSSLSVDLSLSSLRGCCVALFDRELRSEVDAFHRVGRCAAPQCVLLFLALFLSSLVLPLSLQDLLRREREQEREPADELVVSAVFVGLSLSATLLAWRLLLSNAPRLSLSSALRRCRGRQALDLSDPSLTLLPSHVTDKHKVSPCDHHTTLSHNLAQDSEEPPTESAPACHVAHTMLVLLLHTMYLLFFLYNALSPRCDTRTESAFPRVSLCGEREIESHFLTHALPLVALPGVLSLCLSLTHGAVAASFTTLSVAALLSVALTLHNTRVFVTLGCVVCGALCVWMDMLLSRVRLYLSHRKGRESENEKERARLDEMRHLIANVAHDLKTPLASIATGLDLVDLSLRDCCATLSLSPTHTKSTQSHTHSHAHTHTHLSAASASVSHMRSTQLFMLSTIHRCIDSVKAAQGVHLVPHNDTVDLCDALSLPIQCVRDLATHVSVRCEALPLGVCRFVVTDKQWLQENLLCLLSNAAKYSAAGDVRVSLSLKDFNGEGESESGRERERDKRSVRVFVATAGETPLSTRCQSPRNAHGVLSTRSAQSVSRSPRASLLSSSSLHRTTRSHNASLRESESVSLSASCERSVSRYSLSTARVEKALRDAQQPRYLCVEVEDAGIGMSDEAMRSLFSPFKQNQRLAGGTGLGLFSLAQRVRALGGRYGVRRRRDGAQGSLFWFGVPYTADPAAAQLAEREREEESELERESERDTAPLSLAVETESPTQPHNALSQFVSREEEIRTQREGERPLRVLLVDDAAALRTLCARLLRRLGCEVCVAQHGAAALHTLSLSLSVAEDFQSSVTQTFPLPTQCSLSHAAEGAERARESERERFDVVLMDLQMPVMDGLEATRRLRALEAQLLSAPAHNTGASEDHDDDTLLSTHAYNAAPRPHRHMVVCMSANADAETAELALAAGADAFVAKPLSVDTLSDVLARVAREREREENDDELS